MFDKNFNNISQNNDNKERHELEQSKILLLSKYHKMQLKALEIEDKYFNEYGNIIGLNSKNSKYSEFDSIQKLTEAKIKINIPKNNLERIQYNKMADFLEITSDFLESFDIEQELNISEQLSLCKSLIDSYQKAETFSYHFSDFDKDRLLYENLIPTITSSVVASAINVANSYLSTKDQSRNHLSKIHTENFDSKNFESKKNPVNFEGINEVVFETLNGQFQIGFNSKSELIGKRKLSNGTYEDAQLEYIEDEDKLILTSNDLFRRYIFNDFKFSFTKSSVLNNPDELVDKIKFPKLNELIFISDDNNMQIGFDLNGNLIGFEKNIDNTYSSLALNYLESTDSLVIKSFNSLNNLKSIKINYITKNYYDNIKNSNKLKSLNIDTIRSENFPKIESLVYKGPKGIYQLGFDKNNNFIAQLNTYDNYQDLEINYIENDDKIVLINPYDGKKYIINEFQSKVEKFEKERLENLKDEFIDFSINRLESSLNKIQDNADTILMKNSELKLYNNNSTIDSEKQIENSTNEVVEVENNFEHSVSSPSLIIDEDPKIETNTLNLEKSNQLIEEQEKSGLLNNPIINQNSDVFEVNNSDDSTISETENNIHQTTYTTLESLVKNKSFVSSIITDKIIGQNKLQKFKTKINNI